MVLPQQNSHSDSTDTSLRAVLSLDHGCTPLFRGRNGPVLLWFSRSVMPE